MKYVCGIDGGGTSVKCSLSDGSKIISSSVKGSSNIYAVGFEKAFTNVVDCIHDAINSAGLDLNNLTAMHFASAGLGARENIELFSNGLEKAFPHVRTTLSDDAYPLLWSSGLNGTGVCAIAGTGSFAFGIDESGKRVRSGGYGWRLGDEGGAYHIAHEAIRMAVRSSEQLAPRTSLADDVLEHFNFFSIKDAIYFVNRNDITKNMIADFAPVVFDRAYKDRDEVACYIMEKEKNEFISYIDSVIRRLNGNFEKKIVLSGGLIDKSPEYRNRIIAGLCEMHPDWDILQAEEGAAMKGSIRLASI